jgi:hypothetical protein
MNDNKPCRLKAGKFYKTRSGSIAYVAATRCPLRKSATNNTAIGWIEYHDGSKEESWTREGRYNDTSSFISSLNLVAEHTFECKEGCGPCGVDMFTAINREGPYCPSCLERETEAEAQDNGQFGVGA